MRSENSWLSAVHRDLRHYGRIHRVQGPLEWMLLPVKAQAVLALMVHRYGSWVTRTRMHAAARVPFKLIHSLGFEIVRHLTGVLIQPWVDIEEDVWIDSSGPVIIGAARIGAGTMIFAGATLGSGLSREKPGIPDVGMRCVIGPGAVLSGPIKVPDGCVIGPNTLLTNSPGAAQALLGVPAIPTRRHRESFIPLVVQR